ncbi:DUF4194 domain-containing protein [Moraxella sp. TY5]
MTPSFELSQAHKRALQELLKQGVIEHQTKPQEYQALTQAHEALNAYLSAFDLYAKIDEVRGLVFICVQKPAIDEAVVMDADKYVASPTHAVTTESQHDEATLVLSLQDMAEAQDTLDDEWTHPLVRRQRLTLEQSLLLAILRQRFVEVEQQQGIGHEQVLADLDELKNQLFVYLPSSGSEAKDDEKIQSLLKQLAEHGVVGKVDEHQVVIRPLIAHLANPENLSRLLLQLRALNGKSVLNEGSV